MMLERLRTDDLSLVAYSGGKFTVIVFDSKELGRTLGILGELKRLPGVDRIVRPRDRTEGVALCVEFDCEDATSRNELIDLCIESHDRVTGVHRRIEGIKSE